MTGHILSLHRDALSVLVGMLIAPSNDVLALALTCTELYYNPDIRTALARRRVCASILTAHCEEMHEAIRIIIQESYALSFKCATVTTN